jgi:transcriptional regulator with XRE-family HTH domain
MASAQQRKAIGARIKELRLLSGLTQATIAEYLGVSVRTYQSWQGGTHIPSEEHLDRLADYHDVPVAYLIAGEGPEATDLRTQIGRLTRAVPYDLTDRLTRVEQMLDAVYDLLEAVVAQRGAERAATSEPAASKEGPPATGQTRATGAQPQ